MKEEKLKYLEKYVRENKKANIKQNYDKIKFIDENEDQYSNFLIKEQKNLVPNNKVEWKEINDDDQSQDEEELKAVEQAKKEFRNDSEDELIGKKRKRHDSESEDESDVEKELDELINDEDGYLVIQNSNNIKSGLVFEIKENKEKPKVPSSIGKELKKQTVYRDEHGRKVEKSQTKDAKKKALEKLNYENLEKWSKGLIQKEEIKLKQEELIKAKNEPFARYDIDEQTETLLKQKDRFGDPMKQLIFKNNFDQGMKINNTTRNLSRGFFLPKCKFSGPPNRFGIEPGFRWDGVDRGTGFEVKYLESINMSKAREQEYHKLRTEEM